MSRTKAQAIAAAARHESAINHHRERRDLALAEAQTQGATLREMADGIGASVEGVRKSIARSKT